MVLYTNAFGPPIRIPLSGSGIEADSISVSLPSVMLRPGTVLEMPVLVDANRVALAQSASMTISFDPSLLRYRGTITGGTAAEGSSFIVQNESPRGVLNLQLRANGSFAERDVFVVLAFDTFLGDAAATNLVITDKTTAFGNDGCSSIFTVHATSGVFKIDSVCGLAFKTATAGSLSVEVWPNPTSGASNMLVDNQTPYPVEFVLYDAFGQLLPLPSGISTGVLDLSNLPVGLYALVAQCGPINARRLVVKQ
jgi:hypothetical protein